MHTIKENKCWFLGNGTNICIPHRARCFKSGQTKARPSINKRMKAAVAKLVFPALLYCSYSKDFPGIFWLTESHLELLMSCTGCPTPKDKCLGGIQCLHDSPSGEEGSCSLCDNLKCHRKFVFSWMLC